MAQKKVRTLDFLVNSEPLMLLIGVVIDVVTFRYDAWQGMLEHPSTTSYLRVDGRLTTSFASITCGQPSRVIHHWQRLTDDGWVSVNRLSYSIVGGRQDGYRGYSYITNHSVGKWRVDVQTLRGQVIGRISFTIE